jgi:hypothetical protein
MIFASIRRAASAVLLCCASCQSSPAARSQNLGTDKAPEARPPAEISASPDDGEGTLPPSAAYPAGRWRLAESSELDRAHLWLSHILIRHRQVPSHGVSFNSLGWAAFPDPPDRSREEAIELATQVARRAHDAPASFSELARQHSDDVTTRQEGGSLGGIAADSFERWPEVLDAAEALGYGEVSHPVETAYGFHIFLRRAPPPEGSYSGARIIIGYDTAPWLRNILARGPIPQRSRAEALALAQSVYERAASNPGLFEQLVQAHSEHRDALRGGDFGEWSTHEHTPFAQAVEKLSQLEVGQVSAPIDSQFGFQIIQRTAPRPRATYAVQRIQLEYDARQPPEASNSASGVQQRLQSIADELQRDPGRFEAYRREICCVRTSTWREGQGSVLQERVLAQLEIGEIAKAPTQLEGKRYALLKRVAPGEWSPERVRFDLPAPAKPSLERFMAYARASQIAALGRAAAKDLELEGDAAQRLLAAHDVEQQLESSGSRKSRSRVMSNVQREVESLLGPKHFPQYVASVERYVEHELLHGSMSRRKIRTVPQLVR